MTATDPRQIFLQEADDLLQELEQTLLDLTEAPADAELLDSAFRALHTIKGSGAMFGFETLAGFTHHVETAFDLVRKGTVPPRRELISLALEACDQMRLLIEQPDTASAAAREVTLAALACFVAAPTPQAGSDSRADADASEDDAEILWRIRFRLARDAMAVGTNPLLLLDELRSFGPATVTPLTDAIPPLDEIEPAGCYLGWEVTLRTNLPREIIEQVFLFVLDDAHLVIEPADGQPVPDAPTPEAPCVGEISDDPHAKWSDPAPPDVAPAEPAVAGEPRGGRNSGTGSIRVAAERLDEMMDRVGELVIAQSRLRQIAAASNDPAVKSVAEEIERLSLELRDTSMGVRMLPISQLFGRFRRMIHDLARDLGKQIELVTVGEETELDKTVIERLNDPLVHLIRNAMDHGLEDPAGRAASGKAKIGRITLSARHAGAEVLVAISDDGRGLDRARIRARAEENGLVAPGAKLTDSELLQVIFQPGFSTARQVTSLSGRGVGMDVVKRTINTLRGTIDIASTAGEGSAITLRLPLTLAIIDGLLVRVGAGRYVIPLSAVEECVELSMENDARSRGRSFLNIRGDLVPFIRLRELFSVAMPADRYQKVVIVSAGELRVGLVVDQVIGDHQTVIKSLSKLHANVDIFSGATILGDGGVALILDVVHLVEQGQQREDRLKAAS
jgi:two-component system chemotaxis sensor kinase CheA